MKEVSILSSQLHIETSLSGSDSMVTTTISITIPSSSHTHTHARWISVSALSLGLKNFAPALEVSFVCLSRKGG